MKFDLELADLKPSVWSFLSVGIMAVVFITLLKVLTTKYPVPGLSDIAAAV